MGMHGQASSRGGFPLSRIVGALIVAVTGWLCFVAAAERLPEREAITRLQAHVDALRPAPGIEAATDFAGYRPRPLVLNAPRRSPSFYRRHLLPRLNSQFDRMAAYQVVPEAGTELGGFPLFDVLTERAQARAERGTTKALKQYLLEATTADRMLDAVRGDESTESNNRRKPLSFRVNIAHGAPKVHLRYRLRTSVLRLGLSADGSVAVEYSHARRMTRARLVAGYDADDAEYDLFCRVRF